jgi:hypothetical protein
MEVTDLVIWLTFMHGIHIVGTLMVLDPQEMIPVHRTIGMERGGTAASPLYQVM